MCEKRLNREGGDEQVGERTRRFTVSHATHRNPYNVLSDPIRRERCHYTEVEDLVIISIWG